MYSRLDLEFYNPPKIAMCVCVCFIQRFLCLCYFFSPSGISVLCSEDAAYIIFTGIPNFNLDYRWMYLLQHYVVDCYSGLIRCLRHEASNAH